MARDGRDGDLVNGTPASGNRIRARNTFVADRAAYVLGAVSDEVLDARFR
jgi:hypothetical protein